MNFLDLSTTSAKIKFGVRVAAILLLILFFVPTISVSCRGQEVVEFSAFEAGVGLIDEKMEESMGSVDDIDPEFITLLFAVMAAFIIWHSNDKPLTTAGWAGLSAACMYLFKYGTKHRIAEMMDSDIKDIEGYIEIEGTGAFTLHILLCVAIAATVLYEHFILNNPDNKAKVMKMWGDIKGKIGLSVPSQSSSSASSSKVGSKVCPNCGSNLPAEAQFCGNCGTKYTEPEKTEPEKSEPEQPSQDGKNICPSCGKEYAEGACFCTGCGKSLYY